MVQKTGIEGDCLFLSRTDVENERNCTSTSTSFVCLRGVERKKLSLLGVPIFEVSAVRLPLLVKVLNYGRRYGTDFSACNP